MTRLVPVLLVLLGLFPMTGRAADDDCRVSDNVQAHDYSLPQVRARLAAGQPLAVVVIGSNSSLGNGLPDPGQAWPGRLPGELTRLLPKAQIKVDRLVAAGTTAPVALGGAIGKAVARHPDLVIWEVGNSDGVKRVPLDEFAQAVEDGVRRLTQAGGNVILMNMQYSPQTEELFNFRPYRDSLDQIAKSTDINLFDRWAVMRDYVDGGTLDPSANKVAQAQFVHRCIARLLARQITQAAAPEETETAAPTKNPDGLSGP